MSAVLGKLRTKNLIPKYSRSNIQINKIVIFMKIFDIILIVTINTIIAGMIAEHRYRYNTIDCYKLL